MACHVTPSSPTPTSTRSAGRGWRCCGCGCGTSPAAGLHAAGASQMAAAAGAGCQLLPTLDARGEISAVAAAAAVGPAVGARGSGGAGGLAGGCAEMRSSRFGGPPNPTGIWYQDSEGRCLGAVHTEPVQASNSNSAQLLKIALVRGEAEIIAGETFRLVVALAQCTGPKLKTPGVADLPLAALAGRCHTELTFLPIATHCTRGTSLQQPSQLAGGGHSNRTPTCAGGRVVCGLCLIYRGQLGSAGWAVVHRRCCWRRCCNRCTLAGLHGLQQWQCRLAHGAIVCTAAGQASIWRWRGRPNSGVLIFGPTRRAVTTAPSLKSSPEGWDFLNQDVIVAFWVPHTQLNPRVLAF